MTDPATFLTWDSDFFGVRVARVNGHQLMTETAAEVDAWCHDNAIDCLYFLADSDHAPTIRLAEDRDYRFVDVRLTFSRHGKPQDYGNVEQHIRHNRDPDVPALAAIARTSYTDSRFYYDANFTREQCDRLYETWITKSTQGYADAVLVAQLQNDPKPVGFISCHLRDDAPGEIGLVGVAERVRGKSFGSMLVTAALYWFAEQERYNVTVVTQGRNIGAQRLYQRFGFQTSDVKFWYHKWYHHEERV